MTVAVRRVRVTAGIALLVACFALLAITLTVEFPAGSRVVAANSAWTISPSAWGPVAATVRWSGGVSGTSAYIVTGTPNCAAVRGIVAQGSGASGSIQVLLHPGTTYSIYACDGANWETLVFSLSSVGSPTYAEPLEGAAAVSALLGVFLLFPELRFPGAKRRRSTGSRHREE